MTSSQFHRSSSKMGGHHSQFTEEELKDYQVKYPFLFVLDIPTVSAFPNGVIFVFWGVFIAVLTCNLNVFT